MGRTIEKNSSAESKNRHKWICAFTNNENQGIGEYPLNLLNSFMFCYENSRQKLHMHNTAMVAPKNTAQNARYVSGIFDNEVKCE